MTLFSSLTVPAFPEVAAETASKTVLTGVMKTCATIRFRIGGFGKAEKCFCLKTSFQVVVRLSPVFTFLECRVGKNLCPLLAKEAGRMQLQL